MPTEAPTTTAPPTDGGTGGSDTDPARPHGGRAGHGHSVGDAKAPRRRSRRRGRPGRDAGDAGRELRDGRAAAARPARDRAAGVAVPARCGSSSSRLDRGRDRDAAGGLPRSARPTPSRRRPRLRDLGDAPAPRRRLQRPTRRRGQAAPPPDGPVAILSSASSDADARRRWMLVQMLFVLGSSHARDQTLLYREFREDIAAATASIGPTTPPGEPVALIRIPRLRVDEVVVEGTASGDTLAGPGHLRKTVLPGPGRHLGRDGPARDLRRAVRRPRRAGGRRRDQGRDGAGRAVVRRRQRPPGRRPVLPAPGAGRARLTLQTAEGEGRIAALTASEVLYVDADAPKGFSLPAGRPTCARLRAGDGRGHRGLPPLALHLALLLAVTLGVVTARQRWSAALVWVVAAPVALAMAWGTTDVALRLLPNVM